MGKKKEQKRELKPTAKNGKPQVHPQQSFKQQISDASLAKLKPFIGQQVQLLGLQLQQEQQSTLRMLYTRLITVEKVIMDKLDITQDQFTDLVADEEDSSSGLKKVDVVKEGDLVRLEVSTKAADQKEFQGTSKMIVENCGLEPMTMGPEIESNLIGLKVGETKEIKFGKDDKMLAKVVINRVSRRPTPPKLKEEPKVEVKTDEPAEEVKNEDSNAGV